MYIPVGEAGISEGKFERPLPVDRTPFSLSVCMQANKHMKNVTQVLTSTIHSPWESTHLVTQSRASL